MARQHCRLDWKPVALAGILVLGGGAAQAADLYEEPQIIEEAPAPSFGGWYLRGDIGYSAQRVGRLDSPAYDLVDSVINTQKDFAPAPFIGIGVGYQWNEYFRTDLTAEYRFRSNFDGFDWVLDEDVGPDFYDDQYNGWKDEYTFLANAYVDLGTYGSVTPFVGAGIGASYNTIHDFTDVGTINGAYGYSDDHGEWHFAWALYAGLGMQLSDQVTLEVAYRYLDLGGASTGDLKDINGNPLSYNPIEFDDLTSHDVKIAMRYALH